MNRVLSLTRLGGGGRPRNAPEAEAEAGAGEGAGKGSRPRSPSSESPSPLSPPFPAASPTPTPPVSPHGQSHFHSRSLRSLGHQSSLGHSRSSSLGNGAWFGHEADIAWQMEALNELLLLLTSGLPRARKRQIHDRICDMLMDCTSEELDTLLLSSDLHVFIKLSTMKTMNVIRKRMEELSIRCKAVLLQEFNLTRRYVGEHTPAGITSPHTSLLSLPPSLSLARSFDE